ncbi:MAG: hypothetical protein ABI729_11130 [Chitinophagales bacterium]
MMQLSQLYNRVIGVPFYQRNAGLFLFIFIIMFGIIPGSLLLNYHLTLIYAMLGSWIFMLTVSGVWLLYALKCFQFIIKTIAEPRQQFLYITAALPKKNQFNALLLTQFFIYLPVLVYGCIVAVVGIFSGEFAAAAYVIAFHLIVCLLSVWYYVRKINRPDPAQTFFLHSVFRIRFKQPFPMFFISQLLNEMKVIFVVTKFFSAIIIIAFLNGFFIDTYDSRVVMLGFMAGLTAHCVMVFEFRKFEESMVGFYRNLPVITVQRWLNFAFIYFLILLPEWIIFGFAIPDRLHVGDTWWLPFFGTGMLITYHCLLYKPPLDMEKYLQWVFGLFAVFFFLLLYKLYLLIILMLLACSCYYFFRWYYRFEQTEGQL